MEQQLWHVVWPTLGEWLPHDRRGDWTEMSDFYAPLIAAGSVAVSSPLLQRYLRAPTEARLLSPDDAAQLRGWLSELTRDGGDRIAGGHPVLAEALRPLRMHILFRCERERLGQVVGRIKSRLASLLLGQPRWSKKGHRLWAKGFWAAEVLNEDLRGQIEAFLEGEDVFRYMVPESEKPALFHPEPHSREELEAEFNSGDADRAYYGFLNAAYFHEADWVEAKCLGALTSAAVRVRLGALAALQILAAVRRELDAVRVVPAIMPLLDDPDAGVREWANDVLADIKSIFGQ